jgi:metallo-beta-lactamase family protein
MVRMTDGSSTIVFSGDLGRLNDPVMKPPVPVEEADYLVVESTYGDRLHGDGDPAAELESVVNRAVRRGGTVVIPAFAVGRAQLIMYYLHELKANKRIPPHLPVYLDSPMAVNTSALLCKYPNDHRLSDKLCAAVCAGVTYVTTREQSKQVDASNMPSVIISASGMATGGRVLHHLKRFAGDARNIILLAGYQAAGTRGARLARGEKELKIHGDMVPVRAEVIELPNMSAYADYAEILEWMGHFKRPPKKVFITHGEAQGAEALQRRITEKFGWNAVVPAFQQTELL